MANAVFQYARERYLALSDLSLATDDLIVYVYRDYALRPVPLSSIAWTLAGGSETVESD